MSLTLIIHFQTHEIQRWGPKIHTYNNVNTLQVQKSTTVMHLLISFKTQCSTFNTYNIMLPHNVM